MAEGEQPRAPRAPRQKAGSQLAHSVNNWKLADASAMKALNAGTATPEQQKRALDWILKNACALPEWAYVAGDQGETNINLGRHFVGQQIMKLLTIDLSTVARTNPHADEHQE